MNCDNPKTRNRVPTCFSVNDLVDIKNAASIFN